MTEEIKKKSHTQERASKKEISFVSMGRILVHEMQLEECVFFLGTQRFEQVLEKYREADIFILPSVIAEDGSRDITPNVLIEAMAMKLPVISTTVTGIPEIVENEVSGILVPGGFGERGVLFYIPAARATNRPKSGMQSTGESREQHGK